MHVVQGKLIKRGQLHSGQAPRDHCPMFASNPIKLVQCKLINTKIELIATIVAIASIVQNKNKNYNFKLAFKVVSTVYW